MANQLEPVVGRLVGDNTDYVRSLSDAERRTGGFVDESDRHFGRLGASIGKFAKVAAFGLGAAAVGVGAFLKSSVAAAEESRKVTAQTEAVIKSTGGVANVSAGQVSKYADSLAALTGIDDEVIASGQNMLLTFTNVRNEAGKGNDVFNQGTKAALNMSVALKQDLQSSSMLVGKALNDPIKGVTALTRSGIQFTEQQKAQIKAMTESGNVLGAQKIILKELETQFGGSAEAAASPMERLKVVVGNLQEQLGARFLPVIGAVAGALADKLPGALDKVGAAAVGLWNLIGKGDFTGGLRKAFGVEEDSPIIAGILKVRTAVMEAWPKIKETVLDAVDAVVAFVKKNWPEIRQTIESVMKTIQSVVKGVIDIVTTIWRNFGEQIMDYVQRAFRAAMDIIQGAMQVIQGIIKTVTSIIHGDWSGAWEGIKQILAGVWQAIQGLIDQAMNMMRNAISIGMEIVGGIFSGAWNGIKGVVAGAFGWILDTFLGFVEHFLSLADRAFGWIPGLGGKLDDAKQWVAQFRDDVNEYIAGIRGEIVITADTRQAWIELEALASYARNVNSIELQSQGYQTSGNQQFARGMDMGPVRGRMGEAVPIIAHAGEWVLTQEQLDRLRRTSMAGGSIVATPAGGARGGNTYIIQIITGTGAVPDEVIRRIRAQLFELENDMPAGQIIPVAA